MCHILVRGKDRFTPCVDVLLRGALSKRLLQGPCVERVAQYLEAERLRASHNLAKITLIFIALELPLYDIVMSLL